MARTATLIPAADLDTLATYEVETIAMAKLAEGMVLVDELGLAVEVVIDRTRGKVHTQEVDSYKTSTYRIANANASVTIAAGVRVAF